MKSVKELKDELDQAEDNHTEARTRLKIAQQAVDDAHRHWVEAIKRHTEAVVRDSFRQVEKINLEVAPPQVTGERRRKPNTYKQ